MKVLIAAGGTAGHINPALAMASVIRAHCPDAETVSYTHLDVYKRQGFAPADDPEIAVLIVLDNPNSPTGSTYGGSLAGPVVQNILSETLPYLGFEPEYTEEELAVVASPVPDVVGALANNALSTLHNAGFNLSLIHI